MTPSPFPPGFPPENLPFVFKNIWAIFIVIGLVNEIIAWRGLPEKVKRDLELSRGYRKAFLWHFLVSNLPWFLLGYLILQGQMGSVFDLFLPAAAKPGIRVWWESTAVIAAILTFWVFMGGAETLAKYPGLIMVPIGGASKIRGYFLVGLCFYGFVGFIFFQGIPFSQEAEGAKSFEIMAPFLFPFFMVSMFLFIGWSLSQMGGWAALAERYREDRPFEGKKFKGRSGTLGRAQYAGVLVLGADLKGFYLSTIFMFRFSHPPLLIPWKDVTVTQQDGTFFNYAVFEFPAVPGAILKLSKKDVLILKAEVPTIRTLGNISG